MLVYLPRGPPGIDINELNESDPLPSSTHGPSTFNWPLQDKSTEDKMASDPVDLDHLPSQHPSHDDNFGKRICKDLIHYDPADDKERDKTEPQQ